MGSRLQQKPLTLNDLERQITTVVSVMRIVTKWLRLDLRGFHYKVLLHISYLHITFDDDIERKSLLMSSIISD